MQKGPVSKEEKKIIADEYLETQKQIKILSEKAERLYALFTPSMKTYVIQKAARDKSEEDVTKKLQRLEEINREMQKIQAETQASSKELKKLSEIKQEITFTQKNETPIEKGKADKGKDISPATHRPNPRSKI